MQKIFKYSIFVLLLISGVFFLFNNFISNYNKQINKTENEISGIVFAQKLQKFILKIQRLRGFSQFSTSSIKDKEWNIVKGEVQRTIIDLKKDIKEIHLLKNLYPKLYNIDYDYIISEIEELIKDDESDPKQLFLKYTYMIEKIKEMMYHLGFKSELLLEPDRNKYFLVDVMLAHLPNLIETTAKIRGELSRAIMEGSATLELRYSLGNSCKACEKQVQKIEKIFNSLSDEVEKARLISLLDSITIESQKMKSYVKKTVVSDDVNINGLEFFHTASKVIDKIFSLYMVDSEFLKKQLENKKAKLIQTKLYGSIIGAGIILFMIITIFSMIRTSILYFRRENKIKDNLTTIINLKKDLKGCKTLEEISSTALLFFANKFNIVQGIIYVYNEKNKKLYLSGSYATVDVKPIIEIGEGLVGEAAIQKKFISTTLPKKKKKFVDIRSINTHTSTIISAPLIDDHLQLVGVVQLAFLEKSIDYDEFEYFKDIIVSFLYDAKYEGINKKYIELIDKNVITSATNKEGIITDVSEAFAKISGYTKEELIGKNHNIISNNDTSNTVFKELWQTISSGNIWYGEIKNSKKNGETYWLETTITPSVDQYNTILGYSAIFNDITDKKRIEEISITDGLTGLYNRHFFDITFAREHSTSRREKKNLAFLIIDIDFFKQYNDNYGHQKGDKALKRISDFMKNSFKRSSDYIYRLGGEEFVILFNDKSLDNASQKANKLKVGIENLGIEHSISSVSEYLTISAGLFYITPECYKTVNEIYKEADDALYKAKKAGRNRVEIIEKVN